MAKRSILTESERTNLYKEVIQYYQRTLNRRFKQIYKTGSVADFENAITRYNQKFVEYDSEKKQFKISVSVKNKSFSELSAIKNNLQTLMRSKYLSVSGQRKIYKKRKKSLETTLGIRLSNKTYEKFINYINYAKENYKYDPDTAIDLFAANPNMSEKELEKAIDYLQSQGGVVTSWEKDVDKSAVNFKSIKGKFYKLNKQTGKWELL